MIIQSIRRHFKKPTINIIIKRINKIGIQEMITFSCNMYTTIVSMILRYVSVFDIWHSLRHSSTNLIFTSCTFCENRSFRIVSSDTITWIPRLKSILAKLSISFTICSTEDTLIISFVPASTHTAAGVTSSSVSRTRFFMFFIFEPWTPHTIIFAPVHPFFKS